MRLAAFQDAFGSQTLLHGGHSGASFGAFHWSYLAVSLLLVGGIGGLLYWYYGTQDSTTE